MATFSRKHIFVIQIILSLVVLGILLMVFDVHAIMSLLLHINLTDFFLALFFYALVNLFLSYRIVRVLDALGEKVSFLTALRSHFLGMLLSDITPARTGYFATAFSLTASSVPFERAMVSILGPQLFDFSIKIIGSALGVLWILSITQGFGENIPLIAAAMLIIGLFLTIMLLLLFSPQFLSFLSFFSFLPFASYGLTFLKRMQENAWAVKHRAGELALLTFLAWTCKSIEWYFIGKALNITFPSIEFPWILAFYAFLQTLLSLMHFVPVPTAAGTGVAEAGAILIFGVLGLDATKGVVYSLLARGVMLTLNLLGIIELIRVPTILDQWIAQAQLYAHDHRGSTSSETSQKPQP